MHPAYFETRFYAPLPEEPWPSCAVILSAYSTTGQVWSRERNRNADAELSKVLQSIPSQFLKRLIGYSPTTNHSEPSWLVDIDFQRGLEIGRRFYQDAIYGVRDGDLFVLRCHRSPDEDLESDPEGFRFVDRFDQRLDWVQSQTMRELLERS